MYEQKLLESIRFKISNAHYNPINQTIEISLINDGNFKLPLYKIEKSIYVYIYGDINKFGPFFVKEYSIENDNVNKDVWDNGEILKIYLNVSNITDSYYLVKVCLHYDLIDKCEEFGNLYVYKPIVYKIYNPNDYDLNNYELRVDIGDVIEKFGDKFKILDENLKEIPFCFESPNGECIEKYEGWDYIWIKIDLKSRENKTIFFLKSDKVNAVNGKYIFLFYDDFSTNPNLNSNWEIYRYSNDLENECFWDYKEKIIYLTKNVSNKACIMFISKEIPYPFIIKVRYKAGEFSGNEADGLAIAFDKNITPFRLYRIALAGGFFGQWSRSSSGDIPSDGYILEIDNYDNGLYDPTDDYIAIARTNIHNGGFPYINDYFKTIATYDGIWHTIEIKVNSSYVNYVKLDNYIVLENIPITPLNNNYIALSAATGGLYTNYVIDYIVVRHYAYLEPIIYK